MSRSMRWPAMRCFLTCLLQCLLGIMLAGCGGSDGDGPAVPSITAHPASVTRLVGETADFSVRAGGSEPLSYQWRKNGADIAGGNTSSFTTSPITAADNGAQFSVAVSNAAGSVTSNIATLTAVPVVAPSIISQPATASVVAGQQASFSVSATGNAPLAYQWQRDGVAIAGANAATYTTPATTLADNSSSYTVVVSNAGGSATSDPAVLGVSAAPAAPAITAQPASATVNEGQSATFSVTASGSAPLAYQWLRNGAAISGATSASYTTPAASAADNGVSFTVVVSNGAGSVTSAVATLRVATSGAVLRFPRVVVGWDAFHTLVRKADGSVWGWGRAEWGQLGSTPSATWPSPAALTLAGPIAAMGAGRYTSTLVAADGTVLTSGLNRNGVLGNGSPDEHRQFGFLPASLIAADALWVVTGNSASVAIRRDGSAWEWGSTLVAPAYGPGGARVGTLSGVVGATLGQGGFKFALLSDGSVWFWGSNVGGIAAGASGVNGSATPLKVPGLDNIVAISSGSGHMLAVRADGTVWSWGWAAQGQLGYPVAAAYGLVPRQVPGLSDVVSVAGGWDHSLALRRDGTVWSWGNNSGGALCLGKRSASEAPQAIPNLVGVTDIAAGQEHSVFAKSDGSVWVCGISIDDALGIPGLNRTEVPTQVPGIDLD